MDTERLYGENIAHMNVCVCALRSSPRGVHEQKLAATFILQGEIGSFCSVP